MTEPLDMSQFIEAKSDQLNADDLIGRNLTIRVTRVTGSDGDQPVAIHFEGDNNKPFKPCKTIRRVLVAVWGRYANDYVGRSMTLYRDDTVQFGGLQVGGIRISHMSHIDKEMTVVVAKSKGKKAGMKILPLKVEAGQGQAKPQTAEQWVSDHIAAIDAAADLAEFARIAAKGEGGMKKLATGHPELHQRVEDAYNLRRLALEAEGKPDEDMGEGFTEDAEAQGAF